MAKKAKPEAESAAGDAVATEEGAAGADRSEEVAAAEAEHAEAQQNVADLKSALAEAEVDAAAKAEAVSALAAEISKVTGPRIKLEDTGTIVAVQPGEERERRLLINGQNYEHVSDAVDDGETIWVYRRM